MVSNFDALALSPEGLQKEKVQNLRLWTLFVLSFDEIIVLGDTHNEINRIGDIEQ